MWFKKELEYMTAVQLHVYPKDQYNNNKKPVGF